MAGTKPLVLLDPHPRTRAMIFATDSWQRLQQFADVVTSEAGPVDAALVDECLPRLCAILGQTPMPEARLQRATALRIAHVPSHHHQALPLRPPNQPGSRRAARLARGDHRGSRRRCDRPRGTQ